MIRQIAPLFFTKDIPATLAWYQEKLGFECLGTWQEPPVYGIVSRDQQVIHFRCAAPPRPNVRRYSGRPGSGMEGTETTARLSEEALLELIRG